MDSQQKELEQLRSELNYYKNMLQWYRDTYETRSIFGVLKDRVNKKIKGNLQFKQMLKVPQLKEERHPGASLKSKDINESSFYASHKMDDKLFRIGVFVHLYYQDLWTEVNGYLKGMGINFDLHISLNEDDKNCNKIIKLIRKEYPQAHIFLVPNKGLDVGPFFELINNAIKKKIEYDFILKFHTKKSLGVNAAIGEFWRKKSYESLMGSQSIVFHILRLFITQPAIGMIGPYESRMSTSMNDFQQNGNANAKNIELLADKLNITDRNLDFFGGTMFWAKWSIFEEKFKKRTLTIDDFEPGYKKDELLSHAMERLFASIVRDAKHTLYELDKNNDYLFYKQMRKKICWIHPGYGIGGGNRVIFEICKEQQKYFDVYSISYMGRPFTNWIDLDHNVLHFSNESEAKNFIDSNGIDYIFATGWQTVDFVKNIKSTKKQFYFIQDFEPWFADAQAEKAKSTYKNAFHSNIVIAEWLKTKLYKEFNLKSTFVKLGTRTCSNGILKQRNANPTKILFYFKLKAHTGRGSDLILLLLKKLVNHKEFELNVFGHEDPKVEGIIFHGELHKEKLLNLYRSNDLFVDLSRHRGIATIALEVAQFGVVSLLSEKKFGLKEYGFVDNENCLFVDSVEDAYKKILLLSTNPGKYQELKKGVTSLSKTFKWEYTVNDFNQVVDLLS